MRSIWIFCVWILFAPHAQAQDVRVRLTDLDYLRYPGISAYLCVTDSAGNSLPVDSASLTLTRNGKPLPFTLFCPGSGKALSIVQVLDNSGSMAGALPDLRNAASSLIDSMRPGDEMALLSFALNTRLLQDFTQSKPLLKSGLALMFPSGATALYDAVSEASAMLAGRGGRRVIILISDGSDNASGATLDETVALAKSSGVLIYTIGLGSAGAPQQALIRLATETGGRYYPSPGPGDLASIYEMLIRQLFSGCCTIDFTLPTCADSLPSLFRVEYRRGGSTARFDTLLALPWRPDTLLLRAQGGPRLMAGSAEYIAFRLSPPVSPALPLSFDVTVRFNPDLLTVDPWPITIGTMCEGKILASTLSAPGSIRITADPFLPAAASGTLFALNATARVSDSSRKVPILIEVARFAQGCANIILPGPDTIEVCQCLQTLPAFIDPPLVVADGESARIAVKIRGDMLARNFISAGEIRYDSLALELRAIRTGAGDPVPWRPAGSGKILLEESWRRAQIGDSLLFTIDWRVKSGKASLPARIALPELHLWARCCYDADTALDATILREGICDRIALLREGVVLNPVSPNPANPTAEISFDVIGGGTSGTTPIRIALFNGAGALVAVIAEDLFTDGRHQLPLDLSRLSSGTYFVLLETKGSIRTRSFVVTK